MKARRAPLVGFHPRRRGLRENEERRLFGDHPALVENLHPWVPATARDERGVDPARIARRDIGTDPERVGRAGAVHWRIEKRAVFMERRAGTADEPAVPFELLAANPAKLPATAGENLLDIVHHEERSSVEIALNDPGDRIAAPVTLKSAHLRRDRDTLDRLHASNSAKSTEPRSSTQVGRSTSLIVGGSISSPRSSARLRSRFRHSS